jgi:hypothetical protein
MISYHLDQTLEKLKGPSREQLIVGNQWAVTALDLYHPGSATDFEFWIDGNHISAKLAWNSEFSTSAMKERKDIANFGAVAIAEFVMSVLLDYHYVEQSEIGDGVDYNFMKEEPDEDDLNFLSNGHYVEMSGILEEGPSNTIARRLSEKHAQISKGSKAKEDSSVIVTLFSQPKTVKGVHR